MKKTIECVPNFSEGRDLGVINKICKSISSVKGIELLNVDTGFDANRTVITFIGTPESIAEAVFNSVETAAGLIDMRNHKGTHPRIGAVDVFPFVPVKGVDDSEAVEITKTLGEKIAKELEIPVYLYEKSQELQSRKNLADIRKGEYEGLENKIKLPEWKPDFGKAEYNRKSGATVMGVRNFLIAYNINLDTDNVQIAKEIASVIRTSGKKIINGANSTLINSPGLLKECKAIGWYIPEFKRAQVSVNLTDYNVTGMHDVMEAVRLQAESKGIRVTGSELVGMVPSDAIIESGKYYLKKSGIKCFSVETAINAAVENLGLNDLSAFQPEKRILGI